MKQLEEVIKKHLKSISEGEDMKHENYMFFGNIEQMKRQCELLMKENHDRTLFETRRLNNFYL